MNEETTDKPPQTWLSRLAQLLNREPQTRDELRDLLREAQSTHQILDGDALAMLEGVLEVSDMQVRDIMVPRSQMTVVLAEQDLSEFLPIIIKSSHSRFPVIGDDKDEILGTLHAKDLLQYSLKNAKEFDIRDILRPVVVVPESKRLNVLLKEFRHKRNHMAIVVDEYGGVSGLVTIEDVLEQIVGEIEDEFDVEEDTHIKQIASNQFTIKALTPVEEFNQYFSTQLDKEECDTIGGLIMHGFGHMPKRGETITIDNYQFEILHADQRRIHLVKVSVKSNEMNPA